MGTNSDLGKFVDLFDILKNPDTVGEIASPILSILFNITLLAFSQNSTITGILSGQIVMEGCIHLRMPVWMGRVVTRWIVIVPVIICCYFIRWSRIGSRGFAAIYIIYPFLGLIRKIC